MKINLNNITVVSINTRDPENSIKAIERSSKYINFGKYLILTDKVFEHPFIETKIINTFNNIHEYSFFCVKNLSNYIETDYCLVVQSDGFVTNPFMWTDEFLNYDYIGAPWDIRTSQLALHYAGFDINTLTTIPNIVGNGGFSLRSKKFLNESSKLIFDFPLNEDMFLCAVSRKKLKENGIKFAPTSIASRFAIEFAPHHDEKVINLCSYFGFHGREEFKKPLLDLLDNYEDDIELIKILKKTIK